MATKKQKQELIERIKFTPMTVQLMIQGYGGEAYAGRVPRETYDFFKKNKYDLEEYASDWDGEWNERVPEEVQPFPPGSAYECDGLWHASGAELSDLNNIELYDENGKELWCCSAGYNELDEVGVVVGEGGGTDLDDLDEGTVVFWGGQGEKGCFFDAEFTLREPFDPKKLQITYENCDGWYLITSVEYDGEELDGTGGYSTTGKWAENKWIIIGDEEVYEAVSIEDRDEDVPVLEGEEEWAQTAIDNADEGFNAFKALADTLAENKTWNSIDTKPLSKGVYECKFAKGVWPLGDVRNAEWTGRSWKEDGKKAPEMLGWREIEEDLSDYLKQGYEE